MSETLKIIGDVHGKTGDYNRLVRSMPPGQRSVQVGDMGLGFRGVVLHQMSDDHKFFRGNHDDPAKCRASKHYAGDFGYDKPMNLFWVAGAFSIDWAWRVPMESWWSDEELSYADLERVIALYIEYRPKYILSHEAPSRAGRYLLSKQHGPYFAAKDDCCNSRTSQALQIMFERHKPKEWVFGHYHVSESFEIDGTKFTCVPELGVYDLDVDNNPEV